MEVQHIFRTGAFVQIVDILGDNVDVELFLEIYKPEVACVGTGVDKFAAAGVIEFVNQRRVARKAFV